jgi:hypothetical protein
MRAWEAAHGTAGDGTPESGGRPAGPAEARTTPYRPTVALHGRIPEPERARDHAPARARVRTA